MSKTVSRFSTRRYEILNFFFLFLTAIGACVYTDAPTYTCVCLEGAILSECSTICENPLWELLKTLRLNRNGRRHLFISPYFRIISRAIDNRRVQGSIFIDSDSYGILTFFFFYYFSYKNLHVFLRVSKLVSDTSTARLEELFEILRRNDFVSTDFGFYRHGTIKTNVECKENVWMV